MILRYRLLGIEQYVVDPEREYEKLAKNLNGSIIKIGPTSQTYINILDIRKESIEDEKGFLATKISRLIGFFNLIFGELNEEEKANKNLEDTILSLFEFKGDKLRLKMIEEITEIRSEFPLWEYRGYTKKESKDEK